MNRVFVHAGTHKTGTTTLQIMLGSWDARPPHPDVFVPLRGRFPSPGVAGHHNVAWQLNRDPRFRAEDGTLEDLTAEVSERKARVTAISSEDFEYLHTRPEELERLASTFRQAGYEPSAVLYLRSREEYAQSLYAELVKHGLACGFFDFIRSLRAEGVFTYAANWAFCFRYIVLTDRFADAFGLRNVIVRPYARGVDDVALERDFVAALLGHHEASQVVVPGIGRANPSLDLLGVLRALHANLPDGGRDAPDPLALAAEVLNDDERGVLALKFAPLDETDVAAFREYFADDDAVLRERYGIENLDASDPRPAQTAQLQKRLMLAAEERWDLDRPRGS